MVSKGPNVAIIGMGYVGLVSAVCFASRGVATVGVDADTERLSSLQKGKSPIHEPQVQQLLSKSVSSDRLLFSSSIRDAGEPEFVLITVGTPSKPDGSIDLRHVEKAARETGSWLPKAGKYTTVAVKSTTVPGTTMGLVKPLLEAESELKLGEFGLCYNPEFLREGCAVEDTFHPDKLVIGGADARSEASLSALYRRFHGRFLPRAIRTTPSNAEMVKYASNSFLSMKVSYINQIASLCAAIPGCDVAVVADALGLDKRIGRPFLNAGLGFGGSCFSKDLNALQSLAGEKGIDLPLVNATLRVNERAAAAAVVGAEKVLGRLEGKKIAVLGLAFKPDTDDMRDAVSLRLIPALRQKGATVVAYDPVAEGNAGPLLPGVRLVKSVEDCVSGSDCAIVVTEWEEFKRLEPSFFKKHMRTPFVFDGRRIYDPESFSRQRVLYMAVGQGSQVLGRPHR